MSGFLVVDKNTGKVVFDKIYTTEGRAQSIINAGLRRGNLKGAEDLVVIPMPNDSLLKKIANGDSVYSTIRYVGELPLKELDID